MSKGNFSDEFKADAVRRITIEGMSVPRVSKALGVSETSLRIWVAQQQSRAAASLPVAGDLNAAQRRIAELQKQVSQLEQEKSLLKKSVAYFVKELDR